MGIFDFFKKKEEAKEERKPEVQAPDVNSPSDEEFKMFAFIKMTGAIPNEEDSWGRFQMEVIQGFLDYMNTLDDYYLENFQELSRKANETNQSVGDPSVNYGGILLELYKEFYEIED